MPAHITLSSLGWTTPEGRALFSSLDLTFPAVRSGLVGRNGVGKTSILRLISGEATPQTGTVSIDATVGVLRQTLQPQPGETIADLFGAGQQLDLLARAEAGAASAEELAEADWTLESRIEAALAQMKLEAGPDTALDALSGGQRTRAMLAALIFAEPDFILLDEPTNNLDRDGRDAVIALLGGWRGGAIVVSHDRELLDTMDQIVELTTLGAKTYGGNWSHYRERKALELAAAEHDLADAERRLSQIGRKAQQTRERQEKRNAAGSRKKAKDDIPRILLGLRKDNAEKTTGENALLAARIRDQASADANAARQKIEILQNVAIALPSTGLPRGRVVLALNGVTAGYGNAPPILRAVSLSITGPERVAITGPNGSGKTTLLRLLSGELEPREGTVTLAVPHALLDQQVSLLDPALTIRDNFLQLNPDANENACRAALARFLFRAEAALQVTGSLSGGQMLRAGLACVLGGVTPPQLLILDEPTNHLDIESIEAVEAGLRFYDGALLVVSHDRAFLDNIGIEREIALDP